MPSRLRFLLSLVIILLNSLCGHAESPAAVSQKVRVEPEVVSYPGETVNLHCSFADHENIELTQVSWIWEPNDGVRDNIAVFHPKLKASYPKSPFSGRVTFPNPSLENPSIVIQSVRMTDAGHYICEYATFPSGNEQGITALVMLAKPKNTASIVTVVAGEKPVVVARCESANGKPPATIKWVSVANGNGTVVSKPGTEGTVTVTSEYRLVPTPANNGKDLSCVVSHRTQDKPESLPLKLAIEYPPQVSIVGYDNNWYVGRTDVSITCQATSNPIPDLVDWKLLSGQMPETVQCKGNKLVVLKVDERVNTTFVCEVKNRLGVGKDQVTVVVRAVTISPSGSTTIDNPKIDVTGSPSAWLNSPAGMGVILTMILLLLLGMTGACLYWIHQKPKRPPTTSNIDAVDTTSGVSNGAGTSDATSPPEVTYSTVAHLAPQTVAIQPQEDNVVYSSVKKC